MCARYQSCFFLIKALSDVSLSVQLPSKVVWSDYFLSYFNIKYENLFFKTSASSDMDASSGLSLTRLLRLST